MKYGQITKSASPDIAAQAADMALINKFTRKELNPNEVYIFNVSMCDNEIDRDYECFTVGALKQLSELYKGKPMIYDHNPKASGQVARIFDTYVEEVAGEVTKSGEPYTRLVGRAYMPSSDGNKDVIDSIDAGIVKEVSVGCLVGAEICSICGKDRYKRPCNHSAGQEYSGKSCYFLLENAIDAYELSLVAIPSQRGAAITKSAIIGQKGEKKNMEVLGKIKSLLGVELSVEDTLEGALTKICTKLEETEKNFATESLSEAEEFLSAEVVKAKLGAEVTAEKVLQMLGEYADFKTAAVEFERLKSAAIETALKNGVKAKGERFNSETNEKILKSLCYSEITAMSKEWEEDAITALNAGKHISQYSSGAASASVNIDDYNV